MIASTDRLSPRPEWIDERLVDETKAVWSPLYGRALTTPEAIEILLSIDRLIEAMQEGNP